MGGKEVVLGQGSRGLEAERGRKGLLLAALMVTSILCSLPPPFPQFWSTTKKTNGGSEGFPRISEQMFFTLKRPAQLPHHHAACPPLEQLRQQEAGFDRTELLIPSMPLLDLIPG